MSKERDILSGRMKRVTRERSPSDWIEVEGASPPIVDQHVYVAVQLKLDDPERRRRGRSVYGYALTGRVKCLRCERAMVGQTLQKQFRYYRCRRAFAGPRHDRCDTLYVRADALEEAVKNEAAKVLSNP